MYILYGTFIYEDFKTPDLHVPASICRGLVNGFPSYPLKSDLCN